MRSDRLDHPVDILQNVIIPEANDAIPFAFEEARASCIVGKIGAMLTAIGLDLKAAIEQFREQVQNVE